VARVFRCNRSQNTYQAQQGFPIQCS
jgi:hypothetical protein